jgi:hypothetical protein
MPNCYISIPVDKLDVYEVQNSIQSGWLVDEENPLPLRPIPTTKHVPLEELTVADVNDGPSELTLPGQQKVLKRASSSEDDFYKPSQIQQLSKKKGLKGSKAAAPDQPSKIQIVQKQPISAEPKPQQKAVSEELVDFLVAPAAQPVEPPAEAKVQPAQPEQEAEKTSEADDPLGFLLS